MGNEIAISPEEKLGKTNSGFTLVELLVVILIIAILAAVGIVALISALNSGKKSSATTVLRNGITAVRAWQSSQNQTNYSGLTYTIMNSAEPDITWVVHTTEATAGENSISFIASGTYALLATKSEKNVCYYVYMTTDPPATWKSTMYASSTTKACTAVAAAGGEGPITWVGSSKNGWNN